MQIWPFFLQLQIWHEKLEMDNANLRDNLEVYKKKVSDSSNKLNDYEDKISD